MRAITATHLVNADYGVSVSDTLRQEVDRGDPTAVLATFLSPVVLDRSVHLRWWISGLRAGAAMIERRGPSEGWQRLADIFLDGSNSVTYTDAGVAAGGRYGYRLAIENGPGVRVVAGEGWVTVPVTDSPPRAVSPVAGGDLEVAFVPPSGRPTRVRLFDAGGRQITIREVSGDGNRVDLHLARAAALPPGLYLVRVELEHPVTLRVVVIR